MLSSSSTCCAHLLSSWVTCSASTPNKIVLVALPLPLRPIPAIDNWSFYLAFSFFRLAAIVQGVVKRAIDGNASNPHASRLGEMVEPLAEMALAVIEEGKS